MSNSILWETIEPKEGSSLHGLVPTVREQMETLAELEKIQAERLAELEALREQQAEPVTGDPYESAGIDHEAEARRVAASVDYHAERIGKLRTAIARPKNQAENIWAGVVNLEKRWKTFEKQAELLEGLPADVAARHGQQAREALGDAYQEATGHKYSDKRPCGAVVTWEPGPEPTAYQKAIRSLKQPPPRWQGEGRPLATFGAVVREWTEEERREHAAVMAQHRGDR